MNNLAIEKMIGYSGTASALSEANLPLASVSQQAPFTAELLRMRTWQKAHPNDTGVPPPTPVVSATSTPSVAPAASPAVVAAPVSQSEAWYKAWIYNEESGNNPAAENSSGCLGLGQACPGLKLLTVCPLLDYACEDNFFTQYMLSRYGSWEAAYEFHLANGWW